jgi:Bacterial alpha-L-rhamnosidase 6 hairpin glycosidase domain
MRTVPFLLLSLTLTTLLGQTSGLQFQSAFLRLEFAPDQPNISALAIDSLKKGKLGVNAVLPLTASSETWAVTRKGNTIEYRAPEAASDSPAPWSFDVANSRLTIRSAWSSVRALQPLVLNFDPILCHPTLLGLFNDDGGMRLPALVHFPDHGTFRITTTSKGLALGYDALRDTANYVRVTFPAATAGQPRVEYTLDVVALYPPRPGIESDSRYDGYRRDFLNIFQLNPRLRVLANHAASDPCAFTVYMYSVVAAHAPAFADGLTALDILRQTLDRYTGGMKAYGMAFYNDSKDIPYDFLDTYPSLILAVDNYVTASEDVSWLVRNYPQIKVWADKMISFDRDGDGLMEYPLSGNSGSWTPVVTIRPSNWWDTIGFAHKDAYANALAYPAYQGMAQLARLAGHPEDVSRYSDRAVKLKSVFFDTFYNPETGVLAGWKSADGKLHDYYFLFVNGAAVTYGLVTPAQGNRIWDKLLAKMREVGYTRFDLGLPGNLIPIRKEDYVHLEKRWGGPQLADGSDAFQIYENGGATACHAWFTIQALYDLGRRAEADAILFPMLKSFEDGGFQGRGPDGMTYDWKDWNGGPHGYEGLLVDGYLALVAAPSAPLPRTRR